MDVVYVTELCGILTDIYPVGDIALKLSTTLDAHLDLKGSSVSIDDQIQLSDVIQSSVDGVVSISG